MARAIKCFACKHPKRKEIDQALRQGVSQAEVLRTIAPDLPKHSLQRHFARDHHLEELPEDWTPGIMISSTPGRTSETKQTKRSKRTRQTRRSRATTSGDMTKVHWELPKNLVKKLKHRAIEEEIPTVQLVREILEKGL